PNLDQHMRLMGVMLTDTTLVADAPAVLDSLTGHLTLDSVRQRDSLTLFRYNITSSTDTEAIKEKVSAYYGSKAVVEVDGDNMVMTGIGEVVLIGFAIFFVVLTIMCRSYMEVVLFLITTGIAVMMNMGTNAILGTVSLVTHSLAAILQMILSMDYSVILMNRFREEKDKGKASPEAMSSAIDASAKTILSSALTTFVGLVMLIFIKFKIGADVGWVLSKGVVFSLICNFTVLPGLILMFEKAIQKTGKRTPSLPVAPVARFERACRWPLTILFVAIFVGAFILQRRTEITFSAYWPTPITDAFPPDNPVMLLYDTDEEAKIPDLLDTLATDPNVISTLSYPSLAVKQLTAKEMTERFSSISPLITEEVLDVVYYAKVHPKRTERLRLSQLEESANILAERGLVQAGMDIGSITLPPAEPEEEPVVSSVVSGDTPVISSEAENSPVEEDPVVISSEYEVVVEKSQTDSTATGLSYEDVTTPLTASQVADLVGADRRLISMVYRMAGKKGKEATMAPYLLVRFVRDEVLTDKRFSRMVAKADADRIHETGRQMDSVYAAGPVVAITDPAGLIAKADSVAEAEISPLAPLGRNDNVSVISSEAVGEVEKSPEPEYVPTPLEVLAEMAFTDARYPSKAVYKALKGAGMDITQEEMDILYLYTASRLYPEKDYKMSVGELLAFVSDDLLTDPSFTGLVPEEASAEIAEAREMLSSGTDILRGDECSLALTLTSYPGESAQTHEFVGRVQDLVDESLTGEHYLIGESVMYKELKDGFPAELLLLTILTVVAIFIIVALTFKSLLIPMILILTVMSGVYVNVYACGAGGKTMLYLSYLIIQGLLMGATIDYSILFTGYYRNCRKVMGVRKSLAVTYYRTVNSILTSGLFITIVPFV
ncbi:MAG: MMPL family transporter, partial [Bacteroidales bacterium]|nr:MMPL family transporter [Bacteroidales bacterium]